jgi:CP family cyanate transporter-like MFS transporter
VVAIVVVAFNLRPALASVGPLIGDIREGTGLSNAALGVLTSLPLLAFAGFSVLAPALGRRLGVERAVAAALALIVVGTAARGLPSVALLFAGTLVLGIGVAVGNVLLPALAKRDFADRSGWITSLYSSSMGFGAAVAAGASVPLAQLTGWRASLALWAVPGLLAFFWWLPRVRETSSVVGRRAGGMVHLLTSPLAWWIALFMGFQSLSFYVVLAWLPDLLVASGASESEAGWLLALSQATGLGGTLLVPLWADRLTDQRRIVWILATLEGVSLAGLLVSPAVPPALSVGLLGFVLGGTFGLALTFLLVRASDSEAASELSGMAQSVGYLLAAVAPPLIGLVRDVSGGWTLPVWILMAVVVGKAGAGLRSARPGTVDAT